MGTVTITISYSGKRPQASPDPAKVKPEDEVQWVCGEGVDEIKNIKFANTERPYFNRLPQYNANSPVHWEGKIAKDAKGKEKYWVKIKTKDGDMDFDPQLEADQGGGG